MKQIMAPVLKQNGEEASWDCIPSKSIDCDGATVEGIEWFTPIIASGILKGYQSSRGSAQPQADSIKTVRVKVGGEMYWIAIAVGATEQVFSDACNACCDAGTPVLALPTIVAPIIEDCVCIDLAGNYNHIFYVPKLYTGQTVIAKSTFNGVPQTTSPEKATAALLVTWLNTNFSSFGTFSKVVNATDSTETIKLVSTTVKCASLVIELAAHDYCATAPAFPAVLTGVRTNGVTTPINNVTVNTLAELIAIIQPLVGGGNISASFAQVAYHGTSVVQSIITAAATKTFTSGACVSLGVSRDSQSQNVTVKAPAKKAPAKAVVKPPVKTQPVKAAVKKAATKKSGKRK